MPVLSLLEYEGMQKLRRLKITFRPLPTEARAGAPTEQNRPSSATLGLTRTRLPLINRRHRQRERRNSSCPVDAPINLARPTGTVASFPTNTSLHSTWGRKVPGNTVLLVGELTVRKQDDISRVPNVNRRMRDSPSIVSTRSFTINNLRRPRRRSIQVLRAAWRKDPSIGEILQSTPSTTPEGLPGRRLR